jgi:hypothetical protein
MANRTLASTMLLLVSSTAAAAPQARAPRLTVDDSVFSEDAVVTATKTHDDQVGRGITYAIVSPPVSLADATDGLLAGTSEDRDGKQNREQADTELARATRAAQFNR